MLSGYGDILTVAEVAEVLYIGKNRVYELLLQGTLKGFRIGRMWKIPKESVIEYVCNQAGLKR